MKYATLPTGVTVVWDDAENLIGMFGTMADMEAAHNIEHFDNIRAKEIIFIPKQGNLMIFTTKEAAVAAIEKRYAA